MYVYYVIDGKINVHFNYLLLRSFSNSGWLAACSSENGTHCAMVDSLAVISAPLIPTHGIFWVQSCCLSEPPSFWPDCSVAACCPGQMLG